LLAKKGILGKSREATKKPTNPIKKVGGVRTTKIISQERNHHKKRKWTEE